MKKIALLLFIITLFGASQAFSQTACVMNYEPNETNKSCHYLIGLDGKRTATINAGIHSATDVDYYAVVISHPGSTLDIDLTNLPKSYGITVYYFNYGNPYVVESDLSYSKTDKLLSLLTTSGTYYIRINSPYEEYDVNNCYTLSVNITP